MQLVMLANKLAFTTPRSSSGATPLPVPIFRYSASEGVVTDRYGFLTNWKPVAGVGNDMNSVSGQASRKGALLNFNSSVYDSSSSEIKVSTNYTLYGATGQNPISFIYFGKLLTGNALLLKATGSTFSTRSIAFENSSNTLLVEGRLDDNSIDSWNTGLTLNPLNTHFVGFAYDGTNEFVMVDNTVVSRVAPLRKITASLGPELQSTAESETFELACFTMGLTEANMRYYRSVFTAGYGVNPNDLPAPTTPFFVNSNSTDFQSPTTVVTSDGSTHTALYHFWDRANVNQNHSFLGYTANTSTGDIGGTDDSLAFSHITSAGDFDLIGRFEWEGVPPEGASVGWGCRTSTTATDSIAFYILLHNTNSLRQVVRETAGANATIVEASGNERIFLRLTRNSSLNQYASYYSTDGTNWALLGPPVISPAFGSIVGPVISGNGSDCQAVLSGVSLTATPPPPPQPSSVTLDLISTTGVSAGPAPDRLVTNWNDRSGQGNHVEDFQGTMPPVLRDSDDEVPVNAIEDRTPGYMQGPTGLTDGNVPRTIAFVVRPYSRSEDDFLIQVRGDSVPTTSIEGAPTAVNSLAPFGVSIVFSQTVTGFEMADIVLGNATASDFVPNGSTYTVNITPSTAANVTIDVPAGVAQSLTGEDNLAADQVTVAYDDTPPTIAINGAPTIVNNTDPFNVTLQFSEAVTGVALGQVAAVNATTSNFATVNSSTYTLDVTPTGAGDLTIDYPADSATDAAGNGNIAATQVAVTYDDQAPSVSINGAPPAVNTTDAFNVTFQFSEDVTGFVVGDIALINAAASAFVAVNPSTYTADITPDGNGNVTINIPAGVAQDAAGNLNTAAPQVSVIYDPVRPGITIQDAPSEIANLDPFSVTFQFTEDVTGFAIGDITLGNATASNFATTNASTYTADITPDSGANVTIDVAENVAQDAAGNGNTAAAQVTVTYTANFPPAGNDAAIQAATLSVVGSTPGHTSVKTYNSPAAGVFSVAETGAPGVGGHSDTADEIVWFPADIAYPFSMIARVQWDGTPPAGAQLGLTTRRQLVAPTHRHCSIYVDNNMQITQAFRTGTTGVNTYTNQASQGSPIWLRIDLNATGSVVTTYWSTDDGIFWNQLGGAVNANVKAGAIAYVGFFTSGNGSDCNAIISGVDIS